MTEEQKINLLKDEYLKLQDIYEDFDRRALTIKGWAITICLGGLAVGLNDNPLEVLFLSAIASLLFWWVEAKWKTFQYSNSLRLRQIEGFFRGDQDKVNIVPLQIYNTWFMSYSHGTHPHVEENDERSPRQKTFSNAKLSVVFTPYLYIILLDILLVCWHLLVGFKLPI